MSDQVISLTSSDEEESEEPPAKKAKTTPNLPECTLTLVSAKAIEDASKTIETVSLDSDDEVSENKDDFLQKDPKNSVDIIETPGKTVRLADVDLISLTDDEEEDIQPIKVNGVISSNCNSNSTEKHIVQINQETVSIIDDSDTEQDTNKEVVSAIDKSERNVENNKKSEADIEKIKVIENNNHSIIIDDSDDETEKENHCENESNETFPVHIKKTSAIDISSASTSKDETADAKALFKKFIRMVEEKIVDSTFEEILPKKAPIIQKYFNRSGTYVNDKVFKTLLADSIEGMKKSSTANGANSAVLAFHKIFENLKSHMTETTIVVEQDNLPKIKKLEHTIKLLRKRIHQLEVAEVNFDDDEDSAYIMLDRYQCRLNKVYAKYCQYINRNPYSGRATYDRITFVNSSYNEINQALTKKYKNSLVFPSYYELEKYITKVSKKEKLNLSEAEIKIEGKKCFKVLGSILQKKRRQELYDSHLDFVECSEDPATKDISLENVLKKNYAEGKEKIEKLYQKYVNKQEKGEDHVSTDEDHSSEETDEDKKDKSKAKKNNKVNTKRKGDKSEKENNQEKRNKNGSEMKEDHKKQKVEDEKDIQEKKIQEEPNNQERISEDKQENSLGNQPDGKDVQKDDIKDQIEFLAALHMQIENRSNKKNILERMEKQ